MELEWEGPIYGWGIGDMYQAAVLGGMTGYRISDRLTTSKGRFHVTIAKGDNNHIGSAPTLKKAKELAEQDFAKRLSAYFPDATALLAMQAERDDLAERLASVRNNKNVAYETVSKRLETLTRERDAALAERDEAREEAIGLHAEVERLKGAEQWHDRAVAERQDRQAAEARAAEKERECEELRAVMQRLEPHLDRLICYASSLDEYEPNRAVHDFRAALSTTPPETPSHNAVAPGDGEAGRADPAREDDSTTTTRPESTAHEGGKTGEI